MLSVLMLLLTFKHALAMLAGKRIFLRQWCMLPSFHCHCSFSIFRLVRNNADKKIHFVAHAFKIPPHLGIKLTEMCVFYNFLCLKASFVRLTCLCCVLANVASTKIQMAMLGKSFSIIWVNITLFWLADNWGKLITKRHFGGVWKCQSVWFCLETHIDVTHWGTIGLFHSVLDATGSSLLKRKIALHLHRCPHTWSGPSPPNKKGSTMKVNQWLDMLWGSCWCSAHTWPTSSGTCLLKQQSTTFGCPHGLGNSRRIFTLASFQLASSSDLNHHLGLAGSHSISQPLWILQTPQ